MYKFFAANPFNVTANELKLPTSTGTISQGLANIVNLLLLLVGMTSVVFIIVGGLQIALSNGDSKRFASGRETIIYASVGLALAISAYAIVTFVAGAATRK